MSGARGLIEHLEHPHGRGASPDDACTGAAGGAACGDLIRISISLQRDSPEGTIADAGFDARGCGSVLAAGSAVVALVGGAGLLDAARLGAEAIARELGGLSSAKRHAAELAADALHRALGAAAREQAALGGAAERTLVAMSGGVDSAVAAMLVAQGGEQAVGVTLELWSDPDNDGELSCCSAQAVRRARDLAHRLGMPHLSIDLRAEFRAGVVDPWLDDHAGGLTPNPCVRCNGSVRLDAMLELAERLGAGSLATGHYARVRTGPLIRMAADERKDQSYVLAALAPASLARLRFPLGHLHKRQVRAIAERAGLDVARRRDSQDLCFLAGTGHDAFLARHGGLGARRGTIVDERGRLLGEHQGVHRFTVGQRRGLGLAAPEPLYVLRTDAASNTVIAGPRQGLLASEVGLRDLTLRRRGGLVDGVRLRAHGRMHPCRLRSDLWPGSHPRADVQLERPAERTAPGQLACMYAGDVVVGHATVAS